MDPVSQQPLPFIPTAGSLWRRLHGTWLFALGWRKKTRKKKRNKRKCPYSAVSQRAASLHWRFPVSHTKFSPHAVSRALRHPARSQQPSNHPLTSMHHGAALNSMSAGNRQHPAKKIKEEEKKPQTSPGGTEGRFHWRCSDATGCRIFSPKTKGMLFWRGLRGRGDEIWKFVPLNATGGYF